MLLGHRCEGCTDASLDGAAANPVDLAPLRRQPEERSARVRGIPHAHQGTSLHEPAKDPGECTWMKVQDLCESPRRDTRAASYELHHDALLTGYPHGPGHMLRDAGQTVLDGPEQAKKVENGAK